MQAERRYNASYSPYGECDRHEPEGGKDVTQVVAAICKAGQAIVAVSDRAMGIPGETVVTEGTLPKRYNLNARTVAMTAGNIVYAPMVLRAVQDVTDEMTVEKAATVLADKHAEARAFHAHREVLPLVVGKSALDGWIERAKTAPQDYIRDVNTRLQLHKIDAQFVVAGVDAVDGRAGEWSAHLWYIDSFGKLDTYDAMGFAFAGCGADPVTATFRRYGHDENMGIDEALYVAYEAARLAQGYSGVLGGKLDLCVIADGRIRPLTDAEAKPFTEEYERRSRVRLSAPLFPPSSKDEK